MHVGEVAGFALALARRAGVAPANVPVSRPAAPRPRPGVRLSFFNDWDTAPGQPWDAAVQFAQHPGVLPRLRRPRRGPSPAPWPSAWAETLAQLVAGACDVQSRARAHAARRGVAGRVPGGLDRPGAPPRRLPGRPPAGVPRRRPAHPRRLVALDAVLRAAEAPEA